MSISENIKRIRDRYSLTQQQLGEIAGVSDKAVSTWESGTAEPRMGAVQKIAEHFNIPMSAIVDDAPDSTIPIDLSSFDPSYLSFMKDAQDEGIDTDDIMRAIELVRKARESVKE